MSLPKLIHYTEGGPYHGYVSQDYSDQWLEELDSLLVGNNPCAGGTRDITPERVNFEVTYEQKAQ